MRGRLVEGTYRVQEFSALAGVTVRTLHHYDRLALLRPRRNRAGYRLYTHRDLERLEQIVALKFLGLSLTQIKRVLDRDSRPLRAILAAQRRALEEKRHRLDLAIGAIRDAERHADAGVPANSAVIARIIEVIEMQDSQEFFRKYYSDEAWAALERRRREAGPELRAAAEEGTRKWTILFRDIRSSLDADPAGETAQRLLARWRDLVGEFTGGNAAVEQGVGRLWADRTAWPQPVRAQSEPFMDPRVWQFIGRAKAASRRS